MNSSIVNLIKDIKSLDYKGIITPYKVFVNGRKLINPVIDEVNNNYIRILHDRGSFKIHNKTVSKIECKREKPLFVKFLFNQNSEITIEF
jgi:hypothetical protein